MVYDGNLCYLVHIDPFHIPSLGNKFSQVFTLATCEFFKFQCVSKLEVLAIHQF